MPAGANRPWVPSKLCRAIPICLRLLVHCDRAAAWRTFCTAGRSRPIRMATMATTTSNSMRVKPRRARRRAQILDTAAKVFAGLGFAATDVQVIADRIGIGKGTIYRYFPTKEALFLAAVERGLEELTEQMDRQMAEETDPLEHLRRAVRTYLGFFA